MKTFRAQLKWQFILIHKNNIITISFVVTVIYGALLFFLKETKYINELLVSLVLNDPSVIGYFFIALFIFTEIKQGVLNALFVTPLIIHQYLISKIFTLAVIGTVCSFGLALSVKGLSFGIVNYLIGSFSICLLSSIVGLIVLTFTSDFLNFALLSIPLFFLLTGISLLDYLGVIDGGAFKYLLPIQGGMDLIDNAVSGKRINSGYVILSLSLSIPIFYTIAFRLFTKKFVAE
jgi:fluoroquinolone transport system permease protein